MANSGQVCCAIKRVYVHEDQHDALVKELVNLAENAKFGDGMQAGNDFGPLNNKMQFDKVTEYVEDARRNGATIHTVEWLHEHEPSVIPIVNQVMGSGGPPECRLGVIAIAPSTT